MTRTRDWETWTEEALGVEVSGLDAYWLHAAVFYPGERDDLYRCESLPNGYFLVSSAGDETKLVLSPAERHQMLEHLIERHMGGMDPEGYFGLRQAEMKDQERYGS